MCGIKRLSVGFGLSPGDAGNSPSEAIPTFRWEEYNNVQHVRDPVVEERTKAVNGTILCPSCQAFIAQVEFEKSQGNGLRVVEGKSRAVDGQLGSLTLSCALCTLMRNGIGMYINTLGPEYDSLDGWFDEMQALFVSEGGLIVQKLDPDGKVTLALDCELDLGRFEGSSVLAPLRPSNPMHSPPHPATGRSCFFEKTHVPLYRHVKSQHSLDHTVGMIHSWMRKCNIEHPLCRQTKTQWSPTRLLDLGTGGIPSDIKLCDHPSKVEPYIALSYCWGPSSGGIQTTKARIANREVSIPYAALPVLFQDAMALTRALGIRFIWIDSLCITQDDPEDWERESSVMAEVYSNSYLTIAATASNSPHTGLFGKRWTTTPYSPGTDPHNRRAALPINTVTIPLANGGRIFIRPHLHLAHERFWDVDNSAAHLLDAPLLSRAWAFQERLLAPYVLHFHAEELVWECRAGVQCECGKLANSDTDSTDLFAKINTGYLKTCFSLASAAVERVSGVLGPVEVGEVWLFLVSEFCQLRLTYESDRLPALSGLASKFQGQVLGRYFAGVWERDLLRGLLFESERTALHQSGTLQMPDGEVDPFSPCCPSWSWASHACLSGQKVTYDSVLRFGFRQHPDLTVEKTDSTPGSTNPLSWVSSTDLVIHGPVIEFDFRYSENGALELGCYTSTTGLKDDALRVNTKFTVVPDMRVLVDDGEKLYGLFVGTSDPTRRDPFLYVLVLRCVDEEKAMFERVGLAKVSDPDVAEGALWRSLNLV